MKISTSTKPILCSPAKSALVIIDMQNFFLSVHLGRQADGAGNKAAQKLLEVAIPSARKAGMQVIWLNWGLTDGEIEEMPPSILRDFAFHASSHGGDPRSNETLNLDSSIETLQRERLDQGLGSDIGPITIEDGEVVEAGRLLMRDTWNASLPPALNASYKEGQKLQSRPDVWIHKNRMSGLAGNATPCTEYLKDNDITTLIFAGVNTDQCVGGSLQDAFSKGFDCLLLKDGCGTTSPYFATECIEFNCARTWGFVIDCHALQKGVEEMLDADA